MILSKLYILIILHIEKKLQASGKSLGDFGLPQLHESDRAQILQLLGDEVPHNGLLQQELLNNEEALHDRAPITLQPSQRQLYDIILAAVTRNQGVAIFFDAPGGYGKTYVVNAILSSVRTLQIVPSQLPWQLQRVGLPVLFSKVEEHSTQDLRHLFAPRRKALSTSLLKVRTLSSSAKRG